MAAGDSTGYCMVSEYGHCVLIASSYIGTQHADTTQAVLPRHPTSPPHKPTPRSPPSSTHKPQFARGAGPHVDSFILEQREQKRRKELTHKVRERGEGGLGSEGGGAYFSHEMK